jgi:hypothetical protein
VIFLLDEESKSGFEPINPWKHPSAAFRRRNLPHLEAPGSTYFATFRCRRGLELTPQAREIVMGAILVSAPKRIDLDSALVMPDHPRSLPVY